MRKKISPSIPTNWEKAQTPSSIVKKAKYETKSNLRNVVNNLYFQSIALRLTS